MGFHVSNLMRRHSDSGGSLHLTIATQATQLEPMPGPKNNISGFREFKEGKKIRTGSRKFCLIEHMFESVPILASIAAAHPQSRTKCIPNLLKLTLFLGGYLPGTLTLSSVSDVFSSIECTRFYLQRVTRPLTVRVS